MRRAGVVSPATLALRHVAGRCGFLRVLYPVAKFIESFGDDTLCFGRISLCL
jgi:hypothetical protein